MPFKSTRSKYRLLFLVVAFSNRILVLSLTLSPQPASAQSFDCAKASTLVELTICGSADLKAQDSALAGSYSALYAAAQARDAALGAELREGQRQWLTQRDLGCAPLAATPTRLTSCLASAYRARLSFLASAARNAPETLPPAPADPSANPSRAAVSAAADQDTILRVDTPGSAPRAQPASRCNSST